MRIMFLAPVLLAGCAPSGEDEMTWGSAPNEPEVETYLFRLCLDAAKGPQRTHYNDLDEMVSECGQQASRKSKFCPVGKKCHASLLPRADIRTILPKQEQPQ